MRTTMIWLDRLRIERAVWTVDFLISGLPIRTQRAILSELRANLATATAEVGAREALRRLGSLRHLANGYLDAEFGEEGRHPSWLKGLFWALAVETFLLGLTLAGFSGFIDGVLAADPHATATYTWHGLSPLFSGQVTFHDGRLRTFSLGFSVILLPLALAAAFALGARAWRWLPRRRS